VGRRKTLLVVIVLGLMALLLSPWTSAPVAVPEPAASPNEPSGPAPVATLPAEEEPAELKAAVVSDEPGFELLREQAESLRSRHPDINVEWIRIDPDWADLRSELRGYAREADVLLVPNERVRELAVGGSLLPVDAAFVGEALSEQFNALVSQVKWNGYVWGVPRDFDPYVIVWNKNVLDAIRTADSAALSPPLGLPQWQSLPRLLADKGLIASWLAIDGSDPLAFLAWLGAVTGGRQDALFDRTEESWNGQGFDQAMELLAGERVGLSLKKPDGSFWPAFAAGKYAAAVVRESAAAKGLSELPASASAVLSVDRSFWDSAFVWPSGMSFVVSSGTEHEEAARSWIAEMTEAANQLQNYEETGRLPVYRSLYDRLTGHPPDLASAGVRSFPNQPPLASEPGLSGQLERLGGLWKDWMEGRLSLEEWKRRWRSSLADAQAND